MIITFIKDPEPRQECSDVPVTQIKNRVVPQHSNELLKIATKIACYLLNM